MAAPHALRSFPYTLIHCPALASAKRRIHDTAYKGLLTPRLQSSSCYRSVVSTGSRIRSLHNDNGEQPPSQRQVLLENLRNESIPNATVSLLTLNRPKQANAMGRVMLAELQESLNTIQQELKEVASVSSSNAAADDTPCPPRCLVVTSSSAPKVFSAGADLKERAGMTVDEAEAFVTALRDTFEGLAQLPIPSIAAIDGVAVGGGLELALACDLRVASASSSLGLPETSLAIVPGAGGTQRLPRLVGLAKAKEWIWTGKRLDGIMAERYGLVNQVVRPGDKSCLDASLELAWHIAQNGPVAIQASKFAIDGGIHKTNMTEALEIERQAYARVLGTNDRLEGLAAFKERRKPNYKGQ